MSKEMWAAIVYSRTYEVDFRFTAIPNDFNEERENWASKYIISTTAYPETLSKRPCWSFFQDDRHCVVGVTCMVEELLKDLSEDNFESLSKDKHKRDLFLFAGYVAQIPHPPIPSMKLELFRELYYEYVYPRWNDKTYDVEEIEKRSKNMVRYEKSFKVDDCIEPSKSSLKFVFNQINEKRLAWSVKANQDLWYAASQQRKPLSICLDLLRKKHLLDGEFLNGTAVDVVKGDKITHAEKLQKQQEVQHVVDQEVRNLRSDSSHRLTSLVEQREGRPMTPQFSGDSTDVYDEKTTQGNKFNFRLFRRSPSNTNIPIIREHESYPLNLQVSLSYAQRFLAQISSSLEETIRNHNQALSIDPNEISDQLKELQKAISSLRSSNSDLSGNSYNPLTEIETEFKRLVEEYESFISSNTLNSNTDDNFSHVKEHQGKTDDPNIEINYGFQENPIQNNLERKDDTFRNFKK